MWTKANSKCEWISFTSNLIRPSYWCVIILVELHPNLSHHNRLSCLIFQQGREQSIVQQRDYLRTKAQSSTFVQIGTFTEQTHPWAFWQRLQSVYPTLPLTRQSWLGPVLAPSLSPRLIPIPQQPSTDLGYYKDTQQWYWCCGGQQAFLECVSQCLC